jgi:hypothetical protein
VLGRLALAVAAAGCAAGLVTFPRHTVAAIAVAAAVGAALSRRSALATLGVLLVLGAVGIRADATPRHTHASPRHHDHHH